MQGPSEQGASPNSAEGPEESTGGGVGSEPVEPAPKPRRIEENRSLADAPSSGKKPALDAEPPVVEGIEADPRTPSSGRADDGRGINRIELEHPRIGVPGATGDDASRGVNRVELDHPDPLALPAHAHARERGISRVEVDAPLEPQLPSGPPTDQTRGLNRVELQDPPIRLPETWSRVKGNANVKRVELPHELDAILGIKAAGPMEEFASPSPSASAPEPSPRLDGLGEASQTPGPMDQPEEPSKIGAAPDSFRAPPIPSTTDEVSKLQERARPRDPFPALPATGFANTAIAGSETAPAEVKKAGKSVPDVEKSPISTPRPVNGNGSTAKAHPPLVENLPEVAPPPSPAAAPAEKKDESAAPVARRKNGWLAWFLGRPGAVEGTVTPIPPLEAGRTEIKIREYERGTAYSRVFFDAQRARHGYALIEPPLDERETRSLEFVKEVLLRTLDVELEIVERSVAEASLALLEERVKKVVRDYRMDLSKTSLGRIIYYLRRDFTGYGPVDVMMHDPDIEDISCDGPGTNVFLYHRRYGSMESNVFFRNSEELDGFVIRMAQRSGKQITIADPLLDSSLPDGSRLQATLGREVTDNGSTFTIRRFRDNPLSPIDLVRMGTMSADLLAYCWIVVQYGANVMLAGGTASGKTTTLNTISLFIPPQSKIVSIEDTREINLPHKNWVRSVTRGGTRGNDLKRVDMFDLLTAALRQRPEYILVGEVRGKEATVAFQAMATGHTVLGTIHADSPRSVVYRLESEPINIPRIVIQSLDVILMQALLNVNGRRQRRIQEVAEIVGIDPASKELLTHGVFMRNPTTDQLHYTGRSYKLQKIAQRNNWSAKDLDREMKRRTQIINSLVGMPGVSFADIGQLFSTYENRPDAVDAELERLRPKGTQAEGTN